MSLETFEQLMSEAFPMATADKLSELAFMSAQEENGRVIVTMRHILFEAADDGGRALRDLYEQIIDAGSVEHVQDTERYAAFLEATATIIAELNGADIDGRLPHELFLSEVLDLRAQSYDDFGRALSAKTRLGKFG